MEEGLSEREGGGVCVVDAGDIDIEFRMDEVEGV